MALQMLLGSAIEAVGKTVTGGLAGGCVAAPAGSGVPLAIGAGRIDMDGNEDHMVFAQTAAPGIDPADALGERDVFKETAEMMTEMVVTRERLDRIGGRVDCPIREDGMGKNGLSSS